MEVKIRTCSSKNVTAELRLSQNSLSVGKLLIGGENRALDLPLSLPSRYIKNGEEKDFIWEYHSDNQTPCGAGFIFSDAVADCTYTVSFTGHPDIDGPIEFTARLINCGADTIRILPGEIFSAGFAFDTAPTAWRIMKESGLAENVVWHLSKDTFFPGTGIYKDVLAENVSVATDTTTNQDFNSGGMIPMIYLDGNDRGAFIAFEWTSCHLTALGVNGGVRVGADFREGFSTRIPSGGELSVPPIYFGIYNGDMEDGSNIFKRWFYLVKTPKTMLNNKNEPMPQTDQQMDLNLDGLGLLSVKWDYGWWSDEKIDPSKPDIWKYYEGSWQLRDSVHKALLERCGCKTMREFGDLVKSKGLNWTVYVLLHDSQHETEGDDLLTSVGKNAHPEWFSNRKIGGVCPVADLGNKECVDYCKRKLHKFFTENHITTWRSDFEPIAQFSDKENRHDANGTDVQYWCSKGFYEILDFLLESVPGFRYESCSSGGSMKDFATMHRATVFNTDDSSDINSLRTTFYDSSYCFPTSQLQLPTNPDTGCPECEKHYAGVGDLDYCFRSLLPSAISFGSWCGADSNHHLYHDIEKYYAEYLNLYNEKVKPLVRDANLYHTLPRPDSIHWDGLQYGCDFIPENRIGGACFLFKPTETEGPVKTVKIRGLNPDYRYSVEFYQRTEQNYEASGEQLMRDGLTCRIDGKFGSDVIFFKII